MISNKYKIFLKHLFYAILLYILCGYSYHLFVYDVYPGVKYRINNRGDFIYNIVVYSEGKILSSTFSETKPWVENGLLHYLDHNNRMNYIYNLNVSIERVPNID